MGEDNLKSPKTSFRFVLMGDSSLHKKVINTEILSTLLTNIKGLSPQPETIFFLGDMVYGGRNVSEQLEQWKSLVKNYYPIEMFHPVLGNHEDNEAAFSNAFPHLPLEQLKGYRRTVYYFDYGSARFIVLNSNRIDSSDSYTIKEEQRSWLENILYKSKNKYNFIMLHVPAFPTGQHYNESLDLNAEGRNALWAIFQRYNVTAVFAGHEHNYCRRLIDKSFEEGAGPIIQNPIYHITAGGAGSTLNNSVKDKRNLQQSPLGVYHYVVIDVSDKKVTLQVYDDQNYIIDGCTIFPQKSGAPDFDSDDNLIPMGSLWRYWDDGTDEGSFWKEFDFDDLKWPLGLAELGYGDGNEATVIKYGPNANRKYITTYFRKQFTAKDASIYTGLTIRLQRDDGAVVYLNGEEVLRSNMPSGSISYDTLAVKSVDGEDEASFYNFEIDAGLLRNGSNVIAVEVHQAKASSSDASFNFQLLGHKKQNQRL